MLGKDSAFTMVIRSYSKFRMAKWVEILKRDETVVSRQQATAIQSVLRRLI